MSHNKIIIQEEMGNHFFKAQIHKQMMHQVGGHTTAQ